MTLNTSVSVGTLNFSPWNSKSASIYSNDKTVRHFIVIWMFLEVDMQMNALLVHFFSI